MGLSFCSFFRGEDLLDMRFTILSTRGVDLILLGPGIFVWFGGAFIKSLASEDAVILKVGPEGASRVLNVRIVDDACTLLGVALINWLVLWRAGVQEFSFLRFALLTLFEACFLWLMCERGCSVVVYLFTSFFWVGLWFRLFFAWFFYLLWKSWALLQAPGFLGSLGSDC